MFQQSGLSVGLGVIAGLVRGATAPLFDAESEICFSAQSPID